MLGHLGAISLKLPNFLTTSQDVTKGADQANCTGIIWYQNCNFGLKFQYTTFGNEITVSTGVAFELKVRKIMNFQICQCHQEN